MEVLKYTWKYQKKYKYQLMLMFICVIITSAWGLYFPIVMGEFIDNLIIGIEFVDIVIYTLFITIFSIIILIINYIYKYKIVIINAKLNQDIVKDIIIHTLKIPYLKAYKFNAAYLNQRLNQDSGLLVNFGISVFMETIIQIISLLFIIITCININFKMTILVLYIVPIYIYIYNKMKKQLFKSQLNLNENINNYSAFKYDVLNNIKPIKEDSILGNTMNSIDNNFNKLLMSLKERSVKSINYTEISSLVLLLINITIFLMGGMNIIKGNMTIGEFTILNTYFNRMFSIFQYFLGFGDSYQSAKVALMRNTELIKIPKEIDGSEIVDKLDSITLENINFSYENNKKLICNLNLKFEKGYIYVIKGSNGAGKSTLTSLLMGIYPGYYKGNILFNDINISNINTYDFRKNIVGFCPQEVSYINQSRNIIKNETEDYEFSSLIDTFDILDKVNCKNIKELSGGEKKKLRLLEILNKSPQLILLDEPEAALDSTCRDALLKKLKKYKSDSITIIISHSPQIIDFADHIIELNNKPVLH